MSTPLVTVIVPTKNAARTLAACLASIRAQVDVPFELIVVDNFSTDETPAIAAEFTDRVMTLGPERSTQRNAGARAASGEFLLFVDADMVLPPTTLASCVAEMREGISGIVVPETSFGVGFWAACKSFEREWYQGVAWMEAPRFFSRQTFLDVGGYDESQVSGEDWDLARRLRSRGEIVSISEKILHDEGHLTLSGTLKKKWYYGTRFGSYAKNASADTAYGKQTGILSRYALFFSKPGRLVSHPLLSAGMLLMKTGEFAVGGAGYLHAKFLS